MTSELDTKAPGPAERRRNRSFYIQVSIAVVATVALFVLTPPWRRLDVLPEALQLVLAFLPLLPLAWGIVIATRFVIRSDEWERGVYLVSAGIGFLAAIGAATVLLSLELAGFALKLGGQWVVVLAGTLAFGIAIFVKSKR